MKTNQVLNKFGIESDISFPEQAAKTKEYELYFTAIEDVLTHGELELTPQEEVNIRNAVEMIPFGVLMDISEELGFKQGNFSDPTEKTKSKIRIELQEVLSKSRAIKTAEVGPKMTTELKEIIDEHGEYRPHQILREFGYACKQPIYKNYARKGEQGDTYYRAANPKLIEDAYEVVLQHAKEEGLVPTLHDIEEIIYTVPTKDLEAFARKHFNDYWWEINDSFVHSYKDRNSHIRKDVILAIRGLIKAGVEVSTKIPLKENQIHNYEDQERKIQNERGVERVSLKKENFRKKDVWGILEKHSKKLAGILGVYFMYSFYTTSAKSYLLYLLMVGGFVVYISYKDRDLKNRETGITSEREIDIKSIYEPVFIYGDTRRRDTLTEDYSGQRPH